MWSTSKNLFGNSPLDLEPDQGSGSLKFVRKATFPSLVHPIHVPPPSSSLPPNIAWPSPSPHHPTGFVGLSSCSIKPITIMSSNFRRNSLAKWTIEANNQWKDTFYAKKERIEIAIGMPVMEFVSVEEEEELVGRMRLPRPCSYAHACGHKPSPAPDHASLQSPNPSRNGGANDRHGHSSSACLDCLAAYACLDGVPLESQRDTQYRWPRRSLLSYEIVARYWIISIL